MIQFNLLPDIKLEYIKARRAKRSVVLIAAIAAGASFAVAAILFMTVNVLQKQHIQHLTDDIQTFSKELKGIDQLDRILTVQNQLNKLTELHDNKAVLSRLRTYILQITPEKISYDEIEVNTELGTMRFKGSADALKTINQFVDTLKFTKYAKESDPATTADAFSEVVLTSFEADDEKGFTYEITLKYDPTIFSSESKIAMIVPNTVTTRSAIERPTQDLIKAIPEPADDIED